MEAGCISKYREKYLQHQTFIKPFRDANYADVQLHLLKFGNTGGMFHLTALHLAQLGVTRNVVKDTMEKLHQCDGGYRNRLAAIQKATGCLGVLQPIAAGLLQLGCKSCWLPATDCCQS